MATNTNHRHHHYTTTSSSGFGALARWLLFSLASSERGGVAILACFTGVREGVDQIKSRPKKETAAAVPAG
jgi:hypothetical protein